MDLASASGIGIFLAAALLIGFVAAAEVAFASTSRSRVRAMLAEGAPRAQVVDRLLDDPARFLSTLMLAKTVSYAVGGGVITWIGLRQSWPLGNIVLGVLVGWFLLVTVQILSRAITLRNPEEIALRLGPLVHGLALGLTPLSFLLRGLGALARGKNEALTDENLFLSEDGLRFLLNVGDGEGVIEEEEKQMIASIFEFGDTTVREIMAPRLDIVAIPVESSLQEALNVIIDNGHSRIPVYEENIDHIIGMLYAKDLLRCFRDNKPDTPIRQLLRAAYFVPESKKLDELFHEMQAHRVHIAIVVDEYGGTAGLVTIEDLLEEIVGEIQDEYDSEEPQVQQLGPDTFIFNARLDLDEVSERLGIDLAEAFDSVDTLGGFIYSQLGRVPEQGETVTYDGWRFTVLAVDSRRIEQVRAEPISHGPSSDSRSNAALLEGRAEDRNHQQGLLSSTA